MQRTAAAVKFHWLLVLSSDSTFPTLFDFTLKLLLLTKLGTLAARRDSLAGCTCPISVGTQTCIFRFSGEYQHTASLKKHRKHPLALMRRIC